MDGVERWNPAIKSLAVVRKEILDKAASAIDDPAFGLSDDELASLRSAVQIDAEEWAKLAGEAEVEDVIGWIRVLTLAETQLSGFETGARSPVIPMFRCLKERNALPADLHTWIRSNSSNRFLPYGSLMDRL